MTEATFDNRYIPKAQIINDALNNSPRPAVGLIISRALQDEIRATRGWITRPAVVDPAFQPAQFEIIISERTRETKTAALKWADLEALFATGHGVHSGRHCRVHCRGRRPLRFGLFYVRPLKRDHGVDGHSRRLIA